MSTLRQLSCRTWLVMTGVLASSSSALAAFGGDIPDIEGTPDALDEEGFRDIILEALKLVLDFLALAAVIFIIIAGIRLIVSGGSDEQKDKAKKTILYVIIGLLIVLFARVIVGFFTEVLPSRIPGV